MCRSVKSWIQSNQPLHNYDSSMFITTLYTFQICKLGPSERKSACLPLSCPQLIAAHRIVVVYPNCQYYSNLVPALAVTEDEIGSERLWMRWCLAIIMALAELCTRQSRWHPSGWTNPPLILARIPSQNIDPPAKRIIRNRWNWLWRRRTWRSRPRRPRKWTNLRRNRLNRPATTDACSCCSC